MGASEWWYEVDYQQNIAGALEKLQRRVFEQVDFYHPWKRRRWAPGPELVDEMIAEAAESSPGVALDDLRHSVELLQAGNPPLAVEHLFAIAGEEGTHSVLDIMFGVGQGFGQVSPLDLSDYDLIFGTLMPTLRQLRVKRKALVDIRGRWMGTYVVAYSDGLPDKIVFAGFSGD